MTPTDSPADQPTPDPAVAPASGATASPKASAPAGPAAMPVDTGEIDRLVDGATPICIECKTGEFRQEIDKYLRLSKRLGVGKERFIVCSTDLTEEQAQGLTAMYDLSFVNLQTLRKHLQKII